MLFFEKAQWQSRNGLSKKYGNFQAGITSSDFPAFHRGELVRRVVYPRVLCMDRLRPEPPVAAAVEGAAVVGNCVRGVLRCSAVVADREPVVER